MDKTKVVKFKIDEKSLFYGCINDFEKGHTQSVHTPINQSRKKEKWRNDILKLIDTNARIPDEKVSERMIYECQKMSKSSNIVQDVFIFSNIMVDGVKLDTEKQFMMYIKKETAESIKKQNGKIGINTHLGRLKLHYPVTLKYPFDGYNVDNKAILDSILTLNKNYAYLIRGFEYNTDTETLNIITSLIGPENALLSTIFRVAKGVGRKLRTDSSMITREGYVYKTSNDDDIEEDKYSKRNATSRANGKKGEDFAFDLLFANKKDAYHTSIYFPESPYDIEYIDENGKKIFVEVKSTQSDKINFRMSIYEYEFMNKYKEQYLLCMVLNVKDKFPKYKILRYEDIQKLNKEITGFKFSDSN